MSPWSRLLDLVGRSSAHGEDEIVGASQKLLDMMKQAEMVAPTYPESVTTPSFTATAMSWELILGSHLSSKKNVLTNLLVSFCRWCG